MFPDSSMQNMYDSQNNKLWYNDAAKNVKRMERWLRYSPCIHLVISELLLHKDIVNCS